MSAERIDAARNGVPFHRETGKVGKVATDTPLHPPVPHVAFIG
ncbi:hypothetical protein ACU5AX_06025 [Sphingomonas sp. XXL09]